MLYKIQEKRDRCRQIFEEITAKNFPNMVKEVNLQIQETQRLPNMVN